MTEREPLWRRYRHLVRSNHRRDVDDELAFHRERLIEDQVARGVDPAEATRRAARRLGDLDPIREDCVTIAERLERNTDRRRRLAGAWQDFRVAARGLRRAPVFTLVAALTLALGIGANAAIFAVVDAVLLRPLPYGEPGRLVVLWEHNLPRDRPRNVVNPANLVDWRNRSQTLSAIAGFTWTGMTLTDGDRAERISGMSVESNFFDVLGSAPALGRTFRPGDSDSTGTLPVVLSHGLWVGRFGGDSGVVGRTVPRVGGSIQVIGVMPRSFRPFDEEAYWSVGSLPANPVRRGRFMLAVGRLASGASLEAARTELRAIGDDLAREHPDFNGGWTVNPVSLQDDVVGNARLRLLVALGAVALVLVIACANVGNLLLVRAQARRREMAVRAAIGASRARVARLWVTEAALLSALGLGLGLAVAWGTVQGIVALAPPDIPRLDQVRFDARVVGFGAAITALVALALGLGGGWSGRARAIEALRGGSAPGGGRSARRVRHGLVVTQVALAITLLSGAGLLLRTLDRLVRVDPGFDPTDIAVAQVSVRGEQYRDQARATAFFRALTSRLRSSPGIEAAGVVNAVPMSGLAPATSYHPADRPPLDASQTPVADVRIADQAYFSTLRIPLLAGRLYAESDGDDPVVVVSAAAIRDYWTPQEAVGRSLMVGWLADDAPPMTIIGVVGDVRAYAFDQDVRGMIYYSPELSPENGMYVVVRSARPAAAIATLQSLVRELDPTVPVIRPEPLERKMAATLADRRSPAVLLGAFALLALIVAGLGLYGVLAYGVTLERRALGIRLALGARPASVTWLVVKSGLGLAGLGLVIGGVASALAGRAMRGLLYDTSPADPVVIVGTALVLAGSALAASWVPARRAARTPAMTVIRSE
ncbi:MAG: ADOP family duplicated permease [Gemmatimonadales bacterium]